MHASLCVVALETLPAGVRQIVDQFLLKLLSPRVVLGPVPFQDALERLQFLPLDHPALPMRGQVLLAIAHDLLLSPHRHIEPAQKVSIVLQLRRSNSSRVSAFAGVVVPESVEFAETLQLFVELLLRAPCLCAATPLVGGSESGDFAYFMRATFHFSHLPLPAANARRQSRRRIVLAIAQRSQLS